MKFLFYLLTIILITGCVLNKNINQFSGNWYTCGNDGTYYELLIKGKVFRYATSKGLITEWYKFKISGDTLIYADPYLNKDSVFTVKAKMTFNNNDEMAFEYIASDEHWTFHRIRETIHDIDNNDKLIKSTHERGEKVNCIDKRTDEEKKRDSLMKPIDFQF